MSLVPDPTTRSTLPIPSTTGPDVPWTARGAPRDAGSLHTLLDQIDADGWHSPAGTALLTYIRETLVRPLTVDLGMRGAASSQAETSAWEDVWEVLNSPILRTAGSPWGLIWSVARRAILTEAVCARFATSPRKAWQLAHAQTEGLVQSVIALEDLSNAQVPSVGPDGNQVRFTDAADAAIDALVVAGWPEAQAAAIVEDVLADTPTTRSTRWTGRAHGWVSYGWRVMAERLDLPAWQARRLVIVLRGTADNPGLLPRLVVAGGTLDIDQELRAALRSTRVRSRPSPVLPFPDPELIAAMRERAS